MKLISFFCALLISFGAISQTPNNLQIKQGLSLIKQKKYSEAIIVLENGIQSQNPKIQAKSYYLIGISNYQIENYSGAINSFETALDISTDVKLDKKIDEYIDATIQMQNFEEAGKYKNKFSYFLGIGYDSNILNLNKDNFIGTDLGSYSAIYGLTYARTILRDIDYQIIPELSVSDSYSLNTSFAANSTTQSTDALQAGFLVPFQFGINLFSKSDLMTPQFGFKSLYLPTDSVKRSLAFTSIYFAFKNVFNASESYIFMPNLIYSIDSSTLTYADPADNQSAKRAELNLYNTFLISEQKHKINLNLSGEQNTADGDNSSYNKITAAIEIRTPMIETFDIGFQIKNIQTDYTKRTTERNDKTNSITVDVLKKITADRNLTFNLSQTAKASNSVINAYQDLSFSLIFSDAYSF